MKIRSALFPILGAVLFSCATAHHHHHHHHQNDDGDRNPAASNFAGISKFSAKFVSIPSGNFQMGSASNEKGRWADEILHSVTLTDDFEIQSTPVTQAQWVAVMGGKNPAYFRNAADCKEDFQKGADGIGLCPNHPVERVSWNDVHTFISKLNEMDDGYAYRLPTEAEWEYAARAGSMTAYFFGEDIRQAGDNVWYVENSGKRSRPVAGKAPNAYGLYDMSGNVWQWVEDNYGAYPKGEVEDPMGPSSGPLGRVVRGGAWNSAIRSCRSATRSHYRADAVPSSVGFRLVRVPR